VPHEHYIVVAPVERITNHISVGVKARGTVVARQIHRDYVMAWASQER
jgi:hypothetical protein